MNWNKANFKGGSIEAICDICRIIMKEVGEDGRGLCLLYWDKWVRDNKFYY